jgi:hypothetical protein
MPQRPANGLLAWQATVGYISTEYSADAALTLKVQPGESAPRWNATMSWGATQSQVENSASLPNALRDLWIALDKATPVFKTPEDAVRQPALYKDNQWIDADTARALDSLIEVTSAVFPQDWLLMIIYRAVEVPAQRVKMRLIAKNSTVQMGGQGPSLREACRDLYRNAAPGYFASSGRTVDAVLL